jgi:N-acetylglucosaminyl-diphospho-decaprenol L-rhamnosyltransferase
LVAVVIVSYQVREELAACLRSLERCREAFRERGGLAVWVVDNGSRDGSAELVRERFPWAHLLASPVNGGYAYGNNLVLRRWMPFGPEEPPRFVLLLNPDTETPPESLLLLVEYLERHPQVGVVGPKLLREDGSLDLACRRSFPTPEVAAYRILGLSRLFPKSPRFARYNLTYRDPDELLEVDAINGACMLVRWEAVAAAGLLDERFFLYGEDLDWLLRMKEAGYTTVYNPGAVVFHRKRASMGKAPWRSTYEFYRAMAIFHRKHYARRTPTWLNGLIGGAIVGRGALAMAAVGAAALVRAIVPKGDGAKRPATGH